MARPLLNLKISLENIHCYDEADGWGNAEPYFWPVFFKIDGDSYAFETGSGLIGFPTVESRNGHHGNLGNTDVSAGDDVAVPDDLGTWQDTLKPIPINDPVVKAIVKDDDFPGICGVVAVLMEQDSWPDDLADTGYEALVNAVTSAVAKVAARYQHATAAPTKEQIDADVQTVKDSAASMVHDAVEGAMSGWQLLWFGTFGNNDDTIGTEAWTFNHDDFSSDPPNHGRAVNDFSQRWSGDNGDWELFGSATGLVPCPADALVQFLSGTAADHGGGRPSGARREHADALAAMRDFRAKDYQALPGLQLWWRTLQTGAPDLVRLASREPATLAAIDRLFAALPRVMASPDEPLPSEHLGDLALVLERVSKSSSILHRAFAHRALVVLPELRGRSWNSAIRRVSSIRPRGRKRC
jgi:hypothetical protein